MSTASIKQALIYNQITSYMDNAIPVWINLFNDGVIGQLYLQSNSDIQKES